MNFSAIYPYTVRYEKRFLSGPLEGMTVPCEVHYATREGADSFRDCIQARVHSDVVTGHKFTAKVL